MRKYDSYKDSGISWVQEIPNHWGKNKFKFLFNEKKSTPNPTLNSGSISFGEVIYKDDESITESTKLSYQEVLEGEFLINPLNLNYDLKSLRISRSKINVVVSQGYIVLLLVSKDNPEYFKFLLRDFDIRHLKSLGSGVRQTISFTHLLSEELPLPPLSEQQQIVSYLDTKTSQIDTLIEKTKLKIQLLKENRTSLINEVVTKGLNPNVEMKDSGVDWIGEIPNHWVVSKFKYHSEIVTGNTPSKIEEDIYYTSKESGFPWVKPSSLSQGFQYVTESEEYLTELGKSQTRIIPKESIMVCSIGNTLGKFGISGLELSTNQQINSVVCDGNTILPRFCLFFVSVLTGDLIKWTNFVTLPIFTKSDFENTEIVVPPLSEQNEIVSYLDKHTQLIDKTISVEERRIELLKEYRQSLISEVVTGKRKVVD